MTAPLLPPPPQSIGRLYSYGLPVVVVLNAMLALLASVGRVHYAHTLDLTETVAYVLGYAGCSLLFYFAVVLAAAMLIARATKRLLRPNLAKIAFWSGVTWVPFLQLVLALSMVLRHQ
jgi:hypothetical protein